MLKWAIILAIVAIIAGALGFTGVAGAAAGVPKLPFFLFLIAFARSRIAHFKAPKSVDFVVALVDRQAAAYGAK